MKFFIWSITTNFFYNFLALYFNFKTNQGVSIGGGTGSVSDMLDSAQLICEKVSSWKVTDSEVVCWSFLIQVFFFLQSIVI